jgi:uncharacterized membrane protein
MLIAISIISLVALIFSWAVAINHDNLEVNSISIIQSLFFAAILVLSCWQQNTVLGIVSLCVVLMIENIIVFL